MSGLRSYLRNVVWLDLAFTHVGKLGALAAVRPTGVLHCSAYTRANINMHTCMHKIESVLRVSSHARDLLSVASKALAGVHLGTACLHAYAGRLHGNTIYADLPHLCCPDICCKCSRLSKQTCNAREYTALDLNHTL